MARLTLETVKQATDTLQNQGKKPSNRNIINWLGYGSFSTLKKLREHHPEVFYCTDTLNVAKYDTHKAGSSLEERVARLEAMVQKLIQVKATSSPELESLQKQVQELTEDLQEMYQLWRNATQPVLKPNAPVPQEVKETTTPLASAEEPTVESSELPDPQQAQAFVSWAQQQKERHQGSWKPVVEWLNQHQIVMLKGQPWTPKGLSDFIRKKKLVLKR
jgi:uncharacterized coiled-coil protein SlyX